MSLINCYPCSIIKHLFGYVAGLLVVLLVACAPPMDTTASSISTTSTAISLPPTAQLPAATAKPSHTPVPTTVPPPTETPTPTSTPEIGQERINASGQSEVWLGDRFLVPPAHFKPEYLTRDGQGHIRYDAPGLHLFVNEMGEWQVTPFEEIEFIGFQTLYGAGGVYTVTSDMPKAEERRREFFVRWIQAEANAEYRQDVFGTSSPTDDQVWDFLQVNGLPIRNTLKTPLYDTSYYFYSIARFAPNLVGTTIDVSMLGLVLVMEAQWHEDRLGIQSEINRLTKISGKLDTKFTPIRMAVDERGRLLLIIVNLGIPADSPYNYRKYQPEDTVLGGHTSTPQQTDPKIVTQQFETILNMFSLWRSSHTDSSWWVFVYTMTLEELNHEYSGSGPEGTYGAYPDQLEAIYGLGDYLIEPVESPND